MTLPRFQTVREAIDARKTGLPLLCYRPGAARKKTSDFARRFPGTVAYAMKVQSEEVLLNEIAAAMLEHPGRHVAFDVASLDEIRHARRLFPDSELFFMHPMKKQSAIAQAYHEFGVRRFVVDHPLEFEKFARANVGKDAAIFVRIASPAAHDGEEEPAYNLSDKFGAEADLAVALLKAIDAAGHETGVAIHAGSQFVNAAGWQESVDLALSIRDRSGVRFKYLDIGGGFPGHYRGTDLKLADGVYDAVFARLADLKSQGFELIAEPGRALVYDAVSVVSEIVGVKSSTFIGVAKQDRRAGKKVARPTLYIDEGIWSTLSESLTADFGWPVRAFMRRTAPSKLVPYYIAGVTCDSCDGLAGEYDLPDALAIGDFIEFGNIGAYGTAILSRFNGFGEHESVIVEEGFAQG